MSSKVCGPVVEKWVNIPDVNGHCTQEALKVALNNFNKQYENHLIYVSISKGFYVDMGKDEVKYKFICILKDEFGRELNYEVMVHEKKPQNERIRIVLSVTIMETSGHCVGPVAPPKVENWVKIPNLSVTTVTSAAKHALIEFNSKHNDNLKFVSTYEGWYMEMGGEDIKLRLHMKVQDCLGRVRHYAVIVIIKYYLTKKVKEILLFELIINWVKILDHKERCVQEVLKYAILEFNNRYKNNLIFHSITEAFYVEMGREEVQFKFLLTVIDDLQRKLEIECVVMEKKPHDGKIIRILISFVLKVTNLLPPKEPKWIKISIITVPFLVDIIKSVIFEFNSKNNDTLTLDKIDEGWYAEMGYEEIWIRVIVTVKDCLGRGRRIEILVHIKEYLTKKIKKIIHFKLLEIKTTPACGQEKKWTKIPDCKAACVLDVVNFATHEFENQHKNNLKFDHVYDGYYMETGKDEVTLKVHFKMTDVLNRLLNYEAVVKEKRPSNQKIIRILISFIIIVTPGHCVGNVDPPKEPKWCKIPILTVPMVDFVIKHSISEFNSKNNDTLKYVSIYDGFYAEMGHEDIKLRLCVKVKDCIGRLLSIEIIVIIKWYLTKKIISLLSFTRIDIKIIPVCKQGEEKWIKIDDVKDRCVKDVGEFAVNEFNKQYKNVLKFDIVYDAYYVEMGNDEVKMKVHLKAIDEFHRKLNFEVIVLEKKPLIGQIIRSLIIFILIATPGHCVGNVDPPKVDNWIKITNLSLTLLVEVAKYAANEYSTKNNNLVHYESIHEGWYMEMGKDNLKIRVIVIVKDCLGRLHKFEFCVSVTHYFTKKIKAFVSFKPMGKC